MKLNIKKNYYFILLAILILFIIFQVCQFETYETFKLTEYFDNKEKTDIEPNNISNENNKITTETTNNTTNKTSLNNIEDTSELYATYPIENESQIDESSINNAKANLLKDISDKLAIVNKKMNKFDEVIPVTQQTYRNFFEKQLPDYLDKNRNKLSNKHVFDISQRGQDKNINELENKINNLMSQSNINLNSDPENIKSIKSHINGQNLNLINQGEYHSIPLNNGCMFVISDKSGDVDYDITNINRTDKNKICLDGHHDQHFKLNKIDNIEGYNKLVGSSVSGGPMDGNVGYPFYVLQPRNFKKYCLVSDSGGVHLEPCNYKKSQRWMGSEHNNPCHCSTN